MTNLERTYKFLNDAGCYFLATVENNQPRVRAFGTILCDGKKLYIQSGKSKNVSKQIFNNPKVEICACKGAEWIRIECELKEADDRNLRVKMLEIMPSLRSMYNEDDGNMVMFEISNAKVTFASFTAPSETVTL